MVYNRFGFSQLDEKTEIDDILKSVKKVDSISAQILLREAYEISYYIFDHNREDSHPWALVTHQSKEDYGDYGPLYRTIYSFRLREINKRFGVDLESFLSLPREIVELMFRMSDEEIARGNREFNHVKDKLDNEFGDLD